jgi:hypothetical protein
MSVHGHLTRLHGGTIGYLWVWNRVMSVTLLHGGTIVYLWGWNRLRFLVVLRSVVVLLPLKVDFLWGMALR